MLVAVEGLKFWKEKLYAGKPKKTENIVTSRPFYVFFLCF